LVFFAVAFRRFLTQNVGPAVDKTASEEEKEKEPEWNARTIRPLLRSGSTSSVESFSKPSKKKKTESNIEDYSDLAGEEDEALLLEKVADFKVCLHATKHCVVLSHY
jgi:hypothetical protein